MPNVLNHFTEIFMTFAKYEHTINVRSYKAQW